MFPGASFLAYTLVALALWTTQIGAAGAFPRVRDDSLLTWGPYRPNLYFGLRPRIPKTLLTGLMWARVEDGQIVEKNLRHTCEQSDGMAGYGWTAYDPRKGGSQTIHDIGNSLDLTTEFFKEPSGPNAGNWGVRVKGVPRHDAPKPLKTAVIFYLAMEEMDATPEAYLLCQAGGEGGEKDAHCEGTTKRLGGFKLDLRGGQPATVYKMSVSDDVIWDAKNLFLQHEKSRTGSRAEDEHSKPPEETPTHDDGKRKNNIFFMQKTLEAPFEFDILFSSDAVSEPMSSDHLSTGIKDTLSYVSTRFDETFTPQQPFTNATYTTFSRDVLSNLLGGLGYFYGDSKVDLSHAPEYAETDLKFWEKAAAARSRNSPTTTAPVELFSFIPSRPFFPRGFLWDEGFHLRLVLEWDLDLALEIIRGWLALMDDDGWIAREQILGPEARSKVPPEFQVQYPHYANPPTLFLAVSAFVDFLTLKDDYKGITSYYFQAPDAAKQYLREIYPLLKKNYEWFRRTQAGNLKTYQRPEFAGTEGYRWKGRTPQHILTSGLDDYPRAQPPHPGELHVDALSWVGAMAFSLRKIAEHLAEGDEAGGFQKQEEDIKQNLETLHWSDEHKAYCDATIENNTHVLACHKGYVSLMPFLLGLMGREHPNLAAVLDLILDEEELWSPYGVRSLTRKSPLYGSDENYWRSPVWLNINFLILEQLAEIPLFETPYNDKAIFIYNRLRENLGKTVYDSWKSTGFVWEQYNPETGAGQRTQHFTGWTSLIVKILSMPPLDEPEKTTSEQPRWPIQGKVMWMFFFLALVIVFRRRLMKLMRLML